MLKKFRMGPPRYRALCVFTSPDTALARRLREILASLGVLSEELRPSDRSGIRAAAERARESGAAFIMQVDAETDDLVDPALGLPWLAIRGEGSRHTVSDLESAGAFVLCDDDARQRGKIIAALGRTINRVQTACQS